MSQQSYMYNNNNPVSYSDPSGFKVKFHGDEKTQRRLKSQYKVAKKYLSKNPRMAKIFNEMEQSKTVYNFYSAEGGGAKEDTFTPGSNDISWDPHGAITTPDGKNLSPAMLLGHEAAHAIENPAAMFSLSHVNYPGFGNLEEARVILGPEHSAAKTLGEGIRWDHSGSMFEAHSVTEHDPGTLFP